jgi:hypothetical protein
MYREDPYNNVNNKYHISKLTPLMIKKRIEDNYEKMDFDEFDKLNSLLTMDSKLRSLKRISSNNELR